MPAFGCVHRAAHVVDLCAVTGIAQVEMSVRSADLMSSAAACCSMRLCLLLFSALACHTVCLRRLQMLRCCAVSPEADYSKYHQRHTVATTCYDLSSCRAVHHSDDATQNNPDEAGSNAIVKAASTFTTWRHALRTIHESHEASMVHMCNAFVPSADRVERWREGVTCKLERQTAVGPVGRYY